MGEGGGGGGDGRREGFTGLSEQTTAPTHRDVMGKTPTLPQNDLSLSPWLSLAWFFCHYYDFPQAGISAEGY